MLGEGEGGRVAQFWGKSLHADVRPVQVGIGYKLRQERDSVMRSYFNSHPAYKIPVLFVLELAPLTLRKLKDDN